MGRRWVLALLDVTAMSHDARDRRCLAHLCESVDLISFA